MFDSVYRKLSKEVRQSNFTTPTLPLGISIHSTNFKITEVFPEDGGPATVISFILIPLI
jgi:hypothetical protein